jgi:hypothetical protein
LENASFLNKKMKCAIFTLYEKHYHFGVAALINSAIRCGFPGEFFVGYRDHLPPWIDRLQFIEEHKYSINGTNITFFETDPPRHLGYHKPSAALDLFERYPELDALIYADPDIVFIAPWVFFERWIHSGVGLVQDCNFPEIDTDHPWRSEWRRMGSLAGRKEKPDYKTAYPNSGFIALQRHQIELLHCWSDFTEAYATAGGDVAGFRLSQRYEAIVSDQDLLAASLMFFDGTTSFLNGHAMGFFNYFYVLSHAVESPKPWAKSMISASLRGFPPTGAAKRYLEYSSSPIVTQSAIQRLWKKIDLRLAQIISRVWRRS